MTMSDSIITHYMQSTSYTWDSNDPLNWFALGCLPPIQPPITLPEQVLVKLSAIQSLPRTCLGGEHCCNRDNGPCSLGKVNILITINLIINRIMILTSLMILCILMTKYPPHSDQQGDCNEDRDCQGLLKCGQDNCQTE